MESKDVMNEVGKGLEKVAMLRDEIRLHLHLASMDVKTEWQKLEPRVFEVENTAKHMGESSRAVVADLVSRLEHFVGRVREHRPTAPQA